MATSKGAAPKGIGKAKAGGRSAKGEPGHGGHGRKKNTKEKSKEHKDDHMAKGKAKGFRKTGGKTHKGKM